MIVIRSTDDNVGEQTEKVSALTRSACPLIAIVEMKWQRCRADDVVTTGVI